MGFIITMPLFARPYTFPQTFFCGVNGSIMGGTNEAERSLSFLIRSYFADLILLWVTFVWGATFVMVKNAIAVLPPFSFNAIRFSLAALALACLIWLGHRSVLARWDRHLFKGGGQIGLWLFAGYAFQTFGLLFTTSAKAGFITGLSVVMVPLLAYWLLRQRMGKGTLAGVCIAAVGLALLTLQKAEAVNIGDLLILLCAFSFAMHIITVSRYAARYPALLLGFVQIATVALLNAIAALLFEPWNQVWQKQVLTSREVGTALLVTSLFATAFAFVAQSHFQKYTTPTRTALIFSLEPVFAALTAYFWAGEVFTPREFSGSLLILAGMILAEWGDGKKESAPCAETDSCQKEQA